MNNEEIKMNNEPSIEEILQEIESENPSIIIIKGSTDPTYSTSEFYEVLIIGNDKHEFGIKTKYATIKTTISEWILKK